MHDHRSEDSIEDSDPDAEFGGHAARVALEKKLLWKIDLRMSILIVIYILNYVRISVISQLLQADTPLRSTEIMQGTFMPFRSAYRSELVVLQRRKATRIRGRLASARPAIPYAPVYLICGIHHHANSVVRHHHFLSQCTCVFNGSMIAGTCSSTGSANRLYTYPPV